MGIIISAIRILASAYVTKPDVEVDEWSEKFINDSDDTPQLISYVDDANFRKPFDVYNSDSIDEIDLDHLDILEPVEILSHE